MRGVQFEVKDHTLVPVDSAIDQAFRILNEVAKELGFGNDLEFAQDEYLAGLLDDETATEAAYVDNDCEVYRRIQALDPMDYPE